MELRGGAWYSEAAVALINSMETNDGKTHVICTANDGCIEGLDAAAVVEVPAVVSGANIRTLHVGKMPKEISALVQHVKSYESLTVEAAYHKSADKAFLALVNHPFIRSANDAELILQDIIEQHAEYIQLH